MGRYRYAAQYCEENVWHLAAEPDLLGETRYAVFVSNRGRRCPMWAQRAGKGGLIVWDYHAALLTTGASGALIYDLDTTLPHPCALDAWLAGSFRPELSLPPDLRPKFRVVEAGELRAGFRSDRSHMRRPNGRWLAPPPPWPAIMPEGSTFDLMQAIDMDAAGPGEVFDLEELAARFGAD